MSEGPTQQQPASHVKPSEGQATPQGNVHALRPQIYRFGFTGSGGDFALIMLKNAVLSVLTLGIYHFYGKVHARRFLWQSLQFAGARFVYTGNAKELIKARVMLIGVLLGFYVVTFALGFALHKAGLGALLGLIFLAGFVVLGPWLTISMVRFRLARTTWRGLRLGIRDVTKEYIKVWVKGWVLTVLSLGFYGAWWSNDTWATLINNVRIGTLQMRYTGRGADLKWTYVKGYILSLLTLGLYTPWFIAEVMAYRAKHTWLGNQTDGFARAAVSVSGMDIFVQFFTQYLLLIFTLGLAIPWVITGSLRWFSERIAFQGAINFDAVLQQKQSNRAGAFGDGLGDALDVGFG